MPESSFCTQACSLYIDVCSNTSYHTVLVNLATIISWNITGLKHCFSMHHSSQFSLQMFVFFQNPELKLRIEKLKAAAQENEYRRMTSNVSVNTL